MRKLASIQKIKNLEEIPGADSIEKATVLGWQVVVLKNEYNIGDFCIYVEIDSLMPDRDEFEFLRKSSHNLRIRTTKRLGQVSQGICFPLSILPKGTLIEEDADVTEILGITKYEPPIPACLSGKVKGSFPSFIPKSDETRVQVLQSLLDKYEGQEFYQTEKLDGSSQTIYIYNEEFGVCSRNMNLAETEDNTYWQVVRKFDIENKIKSLNRNIALQGELIGEGIQKNKYRIKGHDIYFFRAYDIDKATFLDYDEFINLIEGLELKTVPVNPEKFTLINDIPKLVEISECKSKINKDIWIEGYVYVPVKEIVDLRLQGISSNHVSFKVINPKFLLKYDE